MQNEGVMYDIIENTEECELCDRKLQPPESIGYIR